jgi:hypothetical protein
MALTVARDVCGLEVSDRTLIDDSWRDFSRRHEVAGPLRGVRVVIVVEGRRQRLLEYELTAIDAQKARRGAAIAHVDREIAADHGLRRPRRGRQPRARTLCDLARAQCARRDLAQDLGGDVERAHTNASGRARRAISETMRGVSIRAPSST